MKKRLIIAVSVALALTIVALLTWSISPSSGPAAALTVIKYTQWPHGARLQLTNRTQRTITYIAEPVLFLQKTAGGWTNTSLKVKGEMALDPRTGRRNRLFFFIAESTPPEAGGRYQTLRTRDLQPGETAEFWVLLERGALPKRAGTICYVSPNKLATKLQPWLAQARRWMRLKEPKVRPVEVWCPTQLSASSSSSAP